MSRISEGDYVFMQLPSGNHKIVRIVADSLIVLGKFGSVSANTLVNLPFYETYDIISKTEVRKIAAEPADDLETSAESGINDVLTMEGNKIQYHGNQTLSMSEIEQFKQSGLKGDALIKKIQEAHQDFDKKTEFSKAKYLKRKKAKYMHTFCPLPMTCDRLLDLYIDKDPARVLGMDPATLAHMLSLANVRPGGRYLIMDESPSVLTTAILERLGNKGCVVIAHENEHPNLDGLKYFPQWMPSDYFEGGNPMVRLIYLLGLFCPEETLPFVEKDADNLKGTQKTQYLRQLYRENQRLWVRKQCELGFDAVIVLSTLNLVDIVPRLLEFAAGSTPLVVYSDARENLVNLTLALKKDLRVLAPTIMETRLRKFQTLPGRMHPTMTAKGYSGVLLHGIRVLPDSAAVAVGMAAQRKKRKIEPAENTVQT